MIRSVDDLNLMSEIINNDTAYESAYYKLTTDLDMSGIDFNPITRFTGVFDGDQHYILNLNINTPSIENTLSKTVEATGSILRLAPPTIPPTVTSPLIFPHT